jgi:hypothetical protein
MLGTLAAPKKSDAFFPFSLKKSDGFAETSHPHQSAIVTLYHHHWSGCRESGREYRRYADQIAQSCFGFVSYLHRSIHICQLPF